MDGWGISGRSCRYAQSKETNSSLGTITTWIILATSWQLTSESRGWSPALSVVGCWMVLVDMELRWMGHGSKLNKREPWVLFPLVIGWISVARGSTKTRCFYDLKKGIKIHTPLPQTWHVNPRVARVSSALGVIVNPLEDLFHPGQADWLRHGFCLSSIIGKGVKTALPGVSECASNVTDPIWPNFICCCWDNMCIIYIYIYIQSYIYIYTHNSIYMYTVLLSHAAGRSHPFSTLSAKNAFETSWRIPAAEWQHRRSPERFRERFRSCLWGNDVVNPIINIILWSWYTSVDHPTY